MKGGDVVVCGKSIERVETVGQAEESNGKVNGRRVDGMAAPWPLECFARRTDAGRLERVTHLLSANLPRPKTWFKVDKALIIAV